MAEDIVPGDFALLSRRQLYIDVGQPAAGPKLELSAVIRGDCRPEADGGEEENRDQDRNSISAR